MRSESDSIQQLSIEFRKADLIIPLEKISYETPNIKNEEDLSQNLLDRHVIKCDTYVNNCAIALLFDALVDKPNRSVINHSNPNVIK
jgi:hypothetical protein